MRLLGTAASGIRAEQLALDTIGNNIANVNTPGFKANQVDFAETLSAEIRPAKATLGGSPVGGAIGVGAGVLFNANGTDFQQGTLAPSDRPLDLGIEGPGFFPVKMADGNTAYTRVGAFQTDASGQLTDMQGNVVQPKILIPSEATDLSVTANGEITGVLNGEKKTFGQLQLAGFENPEGLQRIGDNLFVSTGNSGAPQLGQPGSAVNTGFVLGTVKGQSLEQSNVDLATSMTDLIQVQRAYQMNARLVQDGDEMWGIANSMRR